MSMDIRSFFNKPNKKPSSSSTSNSNVVKVEINDDEVKKASKDLNRKRRIIDSDEEDDDKQDPERISKGKKSKSSPKKLVEVDVKSMFGSEPVKRKERSKAEKKGLNNSKSIIDLEDDDDADVSIVLDQLESTKVKTPKKEIKKEVFKEEKKSSTKKSSEKKKRNKSKSPSPQKSPPNETVTNSSKKVRKVKEFSVEEDEARQERKQAALALYHKMKSRPTCLNHGCKEIPKGSPDCLKGLQFVISGVLESMEREEASDLIKSHGGNVVSGLSKKVTHMLVGEEAGPAKIAKAETMGIKQISEDELLDLIRKNSDIKVKSPVKETKVKVEKSEVLKDSPGKENKDKNEEDKKKSPPAKKIKTDPTPIIPSTSTSSTSSISSTKPEYEFSFVDKYKPTAVKNIVGQQGPSGNATKLMNWLSKWYKNNDGTKKHSKPNPWAKDNDGSAFKAALLSGPPGVGKTTTAHLVSRELQFDVVEFNASDTRSKKLLKEEVSSLLSNTSMHGYAIGASAKPSKRRVLIMDEVDGMAGNEDRGGVAELIGFIKESQVPIICMCNDRNHPKIRSLANYCFDLRFYKPSTQQIRGAMMSVCFKEGIKIEPTAVDEIINGTGNDIRQTLNHLALYSASKNTKIVTADAKKTAKSSEKDIKIGTFDVTRRIFSADERKKMSFQDKFDLFFNDYSMTALFVQENYLKARPDCDRPELLKRIAKTSDALSFGDLVESKIRSSQAWAMLPTQSTFSCFLPGEYMGGSFNAATNFPSWLGKYARSNKRKRLAQEIHDHTRISTSGSRLSVRLDYAQFLVDAIVRPLKERGGEGIPDALSVIKEYRLLREDIDSLLELSTWPKMKNPWDSVDSKVKAALTRAYNKEVQPFSYSVQSSVKKKSSKMSDDYEDPENDEVIESEGEEDESIEKNSMIKIKKPTQSKESKAVKSSAKTSKSKK